jgi:hypothetical protein
MGPLGSWGRWGSRWGRRVGVGPTALGSVPHNHIYLFPGSPGGIFQEVRKVSLSVDFRGILKRCVPKGKRASPPRRIEACNPPSRRRPFPSILQEWHLFLQDGEMQPSPDEPSADKGTSSPPALSSTSVWRRGRWDDTQRIWVQIANGFGEIFRGFGNRGEVTQRRPSGSRANAGLNDSIPLGLGDVVGSS